MDDLAQVLSRLGRIEQKVDDIRSRLCDHEPRLRTLEQARFEAAGATAARRRWGRFVADTLKLLVAGAVGWLSRAATGQH
jgi:hypothetical protein